MSFLASFTGLLVLATPSPAPPADVDLRIEVMEEEELLRIARALIPELVELADWCHRQRLYAERDRMWRGVLLLDPEHARARKALRYHYFQRRGWVQASSYKTPKNRNPKALPELEERYRLALQGYRIGVFRYLAQERATMAAQKREDILRDLLVLDEADRTVRTALGETLLEGRWVLTETASTIKRRQFIPSLAKASLEATPDPERVVMTDVERGYGLFRDGGRATPLVRVLGVVADGETARTAKVTHAAGDYFRSVLRERQAHRDDYTIYLFTSPAQRDQVLAKIPEIDQKLLALIRRAGGGWLGKDSLYGEWDPDPVRRLDGATRQTLGTLLMDAYGIDGRHGWAWEGMGLYLTYYLIGTRRTYFFEGGEYQPKTQTSLWWLLQTPGLDWMAEGRKLLLGDNAPKLEFLLGRNVNSMREKDMLFSYVLAAYLIEGRPDEVPKLLRRLGSGEHPTKAFESVLGHSIPQLEGRIRRWLRETRPR